MARRSSRSASASARPAKRPSGSSRARRAYAETKSASALEFSFTGTPRTRLGLNGKIFSPWIAAWRSIGVRATARIPGDARASYGSHPTKSLRSSAAERESAAALASAASTILLQAFSGELVDGDCLAGHSLDGVPLDDPFSRSFAHPAPERVAGEQGIDRPCQRIDRRRRDEEAVAPALDQFRPAPDVGSNDGKARRHRLERDERRRLIALGRKQEDVR